MIRDLEAVLLSIPDPTSRAYVREAVQCYSAGAYRAAVVLAVAAGMDGLRLRLLELARSGGASQPVVSASTEVEKRFTNQEAFESTLIDAAENVATFFTPSEAGKARVMLKTRHLCAHPSGHLGSAEEARDVITSVVDLILSRPAKLGMSGITTLIARLESPNFFPNANDEIHSRQVVASELGLLHPSLVNALVARLVALITSPKTASASAKPARANAIVFLVGMARAGGDAREAVWRYAERIIEPAATAREAFALTAADPQGVKLARPLARDRLISTVRRTLSQQDAQRAAAALVSSGVLTAEERGEIVEAATSTLLADEHSFLQAGEAVIRLGIPEVEQEFFRRVAEACGSPIFTIANNAIDYMQELSAAAAARVTPEARVTYLLASASHLGRSYAAFSATGLARDGLGERADFFDALLAAAGADAEALRNRETNWDGVRALAEASGRNDVLPALVDLFQDATEFSGSAVAMLDEIIANGQRPFAKRAERIRDHVVGLLPP